MLAMSTLQPHCFETIFCLSDKNALPTKTGITQNGSDNFRLNVTLCLNLLLKMYVIERTLQIQLTNSVTSLSVAVVLWIGKLCNFSTDGDLQSIV